MNRLSWRRTGKLLTEFFMKDAVDEGKIKGCSIRFANVYSKNELNPKHIKELEAARNRKCLSMIGVKCSIGARADLGRPTTTAIENKNNFMQYLKEI